jgi:hypothetical protein
MIAKDWPGWIEKVMSLRAWKSLKYFSDRGVRRIMRVRADAML